MAMWRTNCYNKEFQKRNKCKQQKRNYECRCRQLECGKCCQLTTASCSGATGPTGLNRTGSWTPRFNSRAITNLTDVSRSMPVSADATVNAFTQFTGPTGAK